MSISYAVFCLKKRPGRESGDRGRRERRFQDQWRGGGEWSDALYRRSRINQQDWQIRQMREDGLARRTKGGTGDAAGMPARTSIRAKGSARPGRSFPTKRARIAEGAPQAK